MIKFKILLKIFPQASMTVPEPTFSSLQKHQDLLCTNLVWLQKVVFQKPEPLMIDKMNSTMSSSNSRLAALVSLKNSTVSPLLRLPYVGQPL